jgi:hypothetical protein
MVRFHRDWELKKSPVENAQKHFHSFALPAQVDAYYSHNSRAELLLGPAEQRAIAFQQERQ